MNRAQRTVAAVTCLLLASTFAWYNLVFLAERSLRPSRFFYGIPVPIALVAVAVIMLLAGVSTPSKLSKTPNKKAPEPAAKPEEKGKTVDHYADLTDEERAEEGLPPREAAKAEPAPGKEAPQSPEVEEEVEEGEEDLDMAEDDDATERLFAEIASLREDLSASLGKAEPEREYEDKEEPVSKMPTWLRWVLVLPAALMSYAGIQFLAGIQSETLPFPDRLQNLWSQAMNSVLGPWAFVSLGARVAPPRKVFETGVALAVIFGILSVALAALALLNQGPPVRSPWWFGVSVVTGVVTAIATCLQLREREPSTAVSRVLGGLLFILSPVVIPIQLVTTFLLGILVSISFGLLLLPISLLWILLFAPLVAASWVCSKAEFLRIPVGFLGIPWAVVANVFVCLMPSMGEVESRAAKMLLTETWPFSWEFWQFQTGRLRIDDSPQFMRFHGVLSRAAEGDQIRQRVVERLARSEALDPGV